MRKKSLLWIVAFFLPQLTFSAPIIDSIKRIDNQGQVTEIPVVIIPANGPMAPQIQLKSELKIQANQIKVMDGRVRFISANQDIITLAIESDPLVFTFEAPPGTPPINYYYLVELKKLHLPPPAPKEVKKLPTPTPAPFNLNAPLTLFAGPTYQTYQNTYVDTTFPNTNWSGLQLRLQAQLNLPAPILKNFGLKIEGRLDTANPNLSQQVQVSALLEKTFRPNELWSSRLGFGVNTFATIGGAPYGLDPSATPMLAYQFIKRSGLAIGASYSPFLGVNFAPMSAFTKIFTTMPVRLFKQNLILLLAFERISIDAAVSGGAVNYANNGFVVNLGKNFGGSK